MKITKELFIKPCGVLGMLVLLLLILALAGCSQVIIELPDKGTVKINTFLKSVDFDKVIYKGFSLEKYKGESPDVKAITPYGIVETKGSE